MVISSATASGFEAKGVWSTGKETTFDFILAAVLADGVAALACLPE